MPRTPTSTILVTGVTGNTGSALLRVLEEKGAAVRVLVRDEKAVAKLGRTTAEIAMGNFDDADSVAAALEGIESAYLVTPSSAEAEGQQMRFAELAAAARIKHLVKLSQFAADEASPVRFLRYHAAVEKRIRELGIGYTFLRPNLYFQGFLAFGKLIANEAKFFAPIGDARVSTVDVRDIAAVAAVVLTEPDHLGKTYTITGPAAVTHNEIAQAFAEAVGHEVKFVDTSPDDFASSLRKFDMPSWQVEGLIEDYAHYHRGEASELHPTVREVTGREPRSIALFARENAKAFTSKGEE